MQLNKAFLHVQKKLIVSTQYNICKKLLKAHTVVTISAESGLANTTHHLGTGHNCPEIIPPSLPRMSQSISIRVRMILALGYWVLGDIRRHWIVLLLGEISSRRDTQYDTDQTAVGTVNMITILTSAMRLLSADDGRESGEGYASSSSYSFEILCSIVLYISLQINTLLFYTLVLGIGIARGQYYWILGALLGIVLTLFTII